MFICVPIINCLEPSGFFMYRQV